MVRDGLVFKDEDGQVIFNQYSFCELVKHLLVELMGISYEEASQTVERSPLAAPVSNVMGVAVFSHDLPYYDEPVPPTVEKGWNFGEHPLVARLASDEERVWSLFRGATWWLPLADPFFFQAPLPTDDQAMIATLGGLRKELEKLNQLAWQADEDAILDWADTEGYPVDGTIDADGQYSKADIPEHTQYDLSLIHI